MKTIDLKEQYKFFLDKMGYGDGSRMHPEQAKQIRQAFYATWGQCLIILRDDVGSQELSDEESAQIYQNMLNQVGDFFNEITDKKN